MSKRLRLEIPLNWKGSTKREPRHIMQFSLFRWNEEKKCYQLKLKGQDDVIISKETADQFPEFFNQIEE